MFFFDFDWAFVFFFGFDWTFVFFFGFDWEARSHRIDLVGCVVVFCFNEKVFGLYEAYCYERGDKRKYHHE